MFAFTLEIKTRLIKFITFTLTYRGFKLQMFWDSSLCVFEHNFYLNFERKYWHKWLRDEFTAIIGRKRVLNYIFTNVDSFITTDNVWNSYYLDTSIKNKKILFHVIQNLMDPFWRFFIRRIDLLGHQTKQDGCNKNKILV